MSRTHERRSTQRFFRLHIELLEARDVPSFLPPVNYPISTTQYGTQVIDIDGDRRADVVGAAYTLNAVAVYKGLGGGRLAAPVLHPIDIKPVEVRVVDINHDGKLDVVTTNNVDSSTPTIGVLLGFGDGTFQPPTVIPMPAGNRHLAVGDLNRDGRLDLATSNGPNNVVSVWTGNGDGSFESPRLFPVGPGAWGIQIADFNGDEWPDVVTVNPSAGQINILQNRGDGSLRPPKKYSAGLNPFAVFTGDVNADGRPDIVVPDFNASAVNVFLINADGEVQAMVGLPSGPSPFYPRLGDFNRDGHIDIATPQYGNSTVGVFLGNGDGTFGPHTDYGVGKTDFRTMAVGDLNNDRFTDVIVPTGHGTGGFLNVLRSDGNGTPAPPIGGTDRADGMLATLKPAMLATSDTPIRFREMKAPVISDATPDSAAAKHMGPRIPGRVQLANSVLVSSPDDWLTSGTRIEFWSAYFLTEMSGRLHFLYGGSGSRCIG